MSSHADTICELSATRMAQLVRAGELSAREVLDAHLRRIERFNPTVNAIVTLVPERAMDAARAADEDFAAGRAIGPLHGLPIAHKDLFPTRGIRTTFGSPIFRDFVPDQDALIVERLRRAGAITIGKTNTPEFGAGSQTYNAVFGETRNPWDTTRTCGGSSGGAAVALACRMLPIADGSDLGGSLRNPASFCNVVGLRPSPGRVPTWPEDVAWCPLGVDGPMARTAEDAALVLSAIAGPDPRSPISLDEPGDRFAQPLERDFEGTRIAWSANLGGLPVDRRVTAVLDAARPTLEALGCTIDDRDPNFSGADEAFQVWRAWLYELKLGTLLDLHREELKDSVVWNIEAGRRLSGPEIGHAEKRRTALYHRMRRFLEEYEFLVLPVSQAPPFEVTEPYLKEIDGVRLETYIDWMKSCYFISVTGLPAVSVPCGFTDEGLPVGLQIVGRHRDDFGVLQLAHALERTNRLYTRVPPIVESAA